MKKIFVVILNFNGGVITLDCLDSVKKSKLKKDIELKIVVVDNASVDDSLKKIREKFPDVILLENENNLGFTGGCNEGARYAIKNGSDLVLFLNNDTVVDENLIQNLVDASEQEDVGGVVPKIYFEKGYEYHKNRYEAIDLGKIIWYAGGNMDWKNLIGENIGVDEIDRGQYDERIKTDLATGCCFMVKAKVLEKVGLFDDRYFLYYEDADLSERIKKKGLDIVYEPNAFLWHKNAKSTGGSGSNLQDYYISRNRLLFGFSYAPMRTKIALLRESIMLLLSGRIWQKKGIIDYFLRKFGKGTFPIKK